jgi:multidrug efflux pump subunit AcrA (membrane-fusion protein)
MYIDVLFAGSTTRAMIVPKQAVQVIGTSSVVFVPVEGEAGKFLQRTVKTGGAPATGLEIVEGLKPGDIVVTDGSFLLRAEAIRQHP